MTKYTFVRILTVECRVLSSDLKNPQHSELGTQHFNYMLKTILFFILIASACEASEFGVNIYGFSYHPDETDSNGNHFHSFNPGIGAQYTFFQRDRHRFLIDGGVYRNSSAHHSEYIATAYRFRVIGGFEIGPLLALYHSPDQNSGKAFLAPLV